MILIKKKNLKYYIWTLYLQKIIDYKFLNIYSKIIIYLLHYFILFYFFFLKKKKLNFQEVKKNSYIIVIKFHNHCKGLFIV